jgi:hypothetical protein
MGLVNQLLSNIISQEITNARLHLWHKQMNINGSHIRITSTKGDNEDFPIFIQQQTY